MMYNRFPMLKFLCEYVKNNKADQITLPTLILLTEQKSPMPVVMQKRGIKLPKHLRNKFHRQTAILVGVQGKGPVTYLQ